MTLKFRLGKLYSNCETLPLYIFCKIVNEGDLNLLIKKGVFSHDYLESVWNNIIEEYSSLDKNNGLINSINKNKSIAKLNNAYITIKSMIRFLWYVSPSHEKYGKEASDIVEDLRKMNYKINCENSEKYMKSLIAADKKSNSLITQINIAKSKIKEKQEDVEELNYDEIISYLSMDFNNIPENLTVKRYLSMKQIIIKKQKNESKRIKS